MEGENFQHLPQGGDCIGTTMASIGSTTPVRRSTEAAALWPLRCTALAPISGSMAIRYRGQP
jgi:hypothetical protein